MEPRVYNKLGKTIKILRVAKGLKQSEVAKQLKVSVACISLIENNKRSPSLTLLNKLSGILDVPVSLFWINLDMSRKDITPQEKSLLMDVRDIMFQIESLRLQERTSS